MDAIIARTANLITVEDLKKCAILVLQTESFRAECKDQLNPIIDKMPHDAVLVVLKPGETLYSVDERHLEQAGWVRKATVATLPAGQPASELPPSTQSAAPKQSAHPGKAAASTAA